MFTQKTSLLTRDMFMLIRLTLFVGTLLATMKVTRRRIWLFPRGTGTRATMKVAPTDVLV